MPFIKGVCAREVLSHSGVPTVEVDVLADGFIARAAVPSTLGTHILRDKGKRFNGYGVRSSVAHVDNYIRHQLKGLDVREQQVIDQRLMTLDGTKNKRDLGANTLLAISMAVCRAGAHMKRVPLYQHIADLLGTKMKIPGLMVPVARTRQHITEFSIVAKGSHADQMDVGLRVARQMKPMLDPRDILNRIERFGRFQIALRGSPRYIVAGRSYTPVDIVDYYKQLSREDPGVLVEDPLAAEHMEHAAA